MTLLALVLALPLAVAATSPLLLELLRTTSADSLALPLRRLEARRDQPAAGAEAALLLGRLHLARGEYREAADAFSRAAARLDPARKPEARYWQGVAWLGVGDANQARAALEEVVRAGGPRQRAAQLALAQAWRLTRQPERALTILTELLEDDELGEVGPAALERFAVLSDQAGKIPAARLARERLLRDYPRSIEAAASRLALIAPVAGDRDGLAVVIGSFIDPGRARSLASEAKRAGFPQAQVVTRGTGLAAVHTVRLGVYPTRTSARQAGDQAVQALGVTFQVVQAP